MRVIYFSTKSCTPCKTFKPLVQAVTAQLGVQLVQIDAEENGRIAQSYGVKAVPALFLESDNQQVINRHVGVMSKGQLESFLSVAR